MLDSLPRNESDSLWIVKEIDPMDQGSREILILQADRNYCIDCTYLIGVKTFDQRAKYTLNLDLVYAEL